MFSVTVALYPCMFIHDVTSHTTNRKNNLVIGGAVQHRQ